jgi:hypothetical protein
MGFEETRLVPYKADNSNKKFINECSGETKKADSLRMIIQPVPS